MNKLALVLGLAVPSLAFAQETPAPAAGKDLTGRFGVGGQLESIGGVAGGVSLKYWISADLGLQVLGAMDKFPDPDGMGPLDSGTELGLGLRALFNIARQGDTNLYGGAGLSLGLIDADQVDVDLLLGVEHFFTDYFSVAGHVGIQAGLAGNSKEEISIGNVGSWGTSFHFYF